MIRMLSRSGGDGGVHTARNLKNYRGARMEILRVKNATLKPIRRIQGITPHQAEELVSGGKSAAKTPPKIKPREEKTKK